MGLLQKTTALAATLACVASAQNGTRKSGYEYVDPLIGTTNGGL
jgi:hypothetical protein